MVAAGFRPGAADRAGPAGAPAGRLVQHGQVGGGGVGGGALGGGAPGLPHHRRVGVPEQQLGEVGLLEDLAALVHQGAGEEGGQGWRRGGRGGGGEDMLTSMPFLFPVCLVTQEGGFPGTKR